MATIKKTVYEPIEPGIYPVRVEAVDQEDGQFGQQLKWHFAIEEPGFEDKFLIGWCSCAFSPKSKLWAWTKALLFGGRDIPDYFDELDTAKLVGQRAQVMVSLERGNDGTPYNKVKEVLPIRAARTAQPAAAPSGNGGATVARTQPRQPQTAASAAGVAPQRGPVPVNVSSATEPPDWLEDAPEPPAAGEYEDMPF